MVGIDVDLLQKRSILRSILESFFGTFYVLLAYLKASPMPPAPTSRFGVASIVDGGSFLVIF